MIYAEPGRHYTLEEYLELDNYLTDAKYEYHNGRLVEISGVNLAHAQVEMNLLFQVRQKLGRRDERMFTGGMHIKAPSFPPYRYANLSVSAGQPEFEEIGGSATLVNPLFLVEIFSPQTEAYDRGDKFSHYKSIPSFGEYWLVSESRPHVSQFIRLNDGWWHHREYNDLDEVVKLVALKCELSLREIYDDVEFDEAELPSYLRPFE